MKNKAVISALNDVPVSTLCSKCGETLEEVHRTHKGIGDYSALKLVYCKGCNEYRTIQRPESQRDL